MSGRNNNTSSDKFFNKNFEIIKKLHSNAKDELNSDIKNYLQFLIKNYSSIFDKNADEVKELLSSSKEMKKLYASYNIQMRDIIKQINTYTSLADKIKDDYGITNKEVNTIIEKLSKFRNLQESIDNNESIKLAALSSGDNITANRYETIVKTQQAQLKNLKKSLNPTEALLLNDYLNNTNQELNDILDISDRVKESREESLRIEEQTVETLERQTKAISKRRKLVEDIRNVARETYAILSKGVEKWKEVDEKVFAVGRTVGLVSEELRQYQEFTLKQYDDIASSLGRNFEQIFKFQEKYIQNTGRAVLLTKEELLSLGSIGNLVGDDNTEEMVKNMDAFGASTNTAFDYLAVNFYNARKFGLDATKSSELLAKNIKMASKYNFSDGINGISKMTLLSQQLKFNLESIGSSIEKFETIEGAIESSAKIQMLGGAFAMNYSNPLTVMGEAYFDAEAYTNRIIDTLSDKAYFDKKKGIVDMAPIDKRFLKEYANIIGISQEDAWNIATQKAKLNEIKPYVNPTLTEDEITYVSNKAYYDKDTGRFKINYLKDGEVVSKDIKDINKTVLSEIKKQEDIDKSIQGDVQGIHSILREMVGKDSKDTLSYNESKKGILESISLNLANMMDGIMNFFKSTLSWVGNGNHWLLGLGGIVSWKLLKGLGTFSVGKFIKGGFSNVFRGIGSKASTIVKNTGKAIGKGGKAIGKLGKGLTKIPGIGKIIGGILLGASALTGISQLFGKKDKSNDTEATNPQEVNPIMAQTESIDELKKQTSYLKQIAEGKTLPNTTQKASMISMDNIENNEDNISMTDIIDKRMFMGKSGQKIMNKAISYTTKKMINNSSKTISKLGTKLIGKTVSSSVSGPLGWISMGTDAINSIGKNYGWWNENSHADKAMNIGSKTLEYAGWGSLIGSVVPVIGTAVGGGIGAAVGAISGVFDEYGDKIKNFFIGDEENNNENNLTKLETDADIATIGIYEYLLSNPSPNKVLANNSYNSYISSLPSNSQNTLIINNENNKASEIKTSDNSNVNLNVNGTLKLATDKNSVDIDINKLIETPSFKNKLLDIIQQGLNLRLYQGRGSNKNSQQVIQGNIVNFA